MRGSTPPFYHSELRILLLSMAWPFATSRAALAEASETGPATDATPVGESKRSRLQAELSLGPARHGAAKRWQSGVLCAVAAVLTSAPAQQPDDEHAARMAEGVAVFRAEVRPLFEARCLPCHGGEQTMGGLDLSSRGSLLASGKVVESAETSAMVAVLRHERKPFMPFGQDRLPEPTIKAVARWIDLGAPYDEPLVPAPSPAELAESDRDAEFWSFQPLSGGEPPVAGGGEIPRNPLDRFIHSRLEAAGIEQNRPADRRTLIRRASLDLLGLPPSPERVDAFVRDSTPGAFKRLIDELLESPHYGERWARHWMDIARFAESHGFEEDSERPFAFHYRDFLIKAFNRDMPYDRFVRLQIAGDELEPENPLALMATGFLGAGPFPTQITEAEFETTRYDELDDMVGTLGTAMLGLTVGCARCHDHKYDPISARDYYAMAAVFGRTTRTLIEYDPSPGEFRSAKAQWTNEREELLATRREVEVATRAEGFERWLREEALDAAPSVWQVLDIQGIRTTSDARTDALSDGSILFSGDNADFEAYTFETRLEAAGVRALRVEALTHPTLPANGPGRSHDGHFVLGVLTAEAAPANAPDADPVKVKFRHARATSQLDEDTGSVTAAVTTNSQKSGWALPSGAVGSNQAAIFELEQPLGFEGGTLLTIRMHFGFNAHFSIGRIRLSVAVADDPGFAIGQGVPQSVAEGLDTLRARGREALSQASQAALLAHYASSDPQWQEANENVRQLELKIPVTSATKIQATAEGYPPARHNAEDKGYPHFFELTHFLSRGDPSQKVAPAQAGFLPFLMRGDTDARRWAATPPPHSTRSRFHRASLAKWITDVDRGAGALLARVIVNRLWHHHFGTGIVATPSNFGRMGARPTHPELLDWLARDLAFNGWRLKRLHRMIMTSDTYKADSSSEVSKAAVDSPNRLRWKWTPKRLEAEAIRDSLLSVAGKLDLTMHGPGTLDEASTRRSVYFFVKRSELIPSMMLFDWPEHLVGIGNRPSTVIAPQALQLLNSPHTRRYAEGFAGRLDGRHGAEAVDLAYQIAFARHATEAEVADGLAFIESQRELYTADRRPDAGRRALADYCQSLMSLNEFLYIR